MSFFSDFKMNASSGNKYYYLYLIVLLLMCFFFKGRRLKFVVPSIMISVFLFNPVIYKYWVKLGLYAYWRIIWVIPVIPICATLPAMIAEKIQDKRLKTTIGLLLVLLFIPFGKCIYTSPDGKFELCTNNYSKLPQSVIEVSERLLNYEDNPKVVAVPEVSVYIRQFSGKIDTLYGRDIYGFISHASYYALSVNSNINEEDGDMYYVAEVMLNEGYDYLVIPSVTEAKADSLNLAGFEWKERVANYDIYKVNGTPTVLKERNNLGQIISETSLDINGLPTDGDRGYSTVRYDYDRDGNKSRELYLDSKGNAYANIDGVSGYEWEYDRFGRCITEKYIDANGGVINSSYTGHAETRLTYKGKNLIKEEFLDCNSKPVVRLDILYSSRCITYNKSNIAIAESYYDEKGCYTMCNRGYASVKRKTDANNRVIEENYYDELGKPVVVSAGYSGIKQEYNDNGTLTFREYMDINNQEVQRQDGYSRIAMKEEEGIVNAVFYDIKGKEVAYDEKNLVMNAPTDWSEWMTPQKGVSNSCFKIGVANLGRKEEGDLYTCQVEIEFRGVSSIEGKEFSFWSQGAVDNSWNVKNVWNPELVSLESPPQNGIYRFENTCIIDEKTAKSSFFDVDFRCDNWSGGSFRVRNVKIEKGSSASKWSYGI